jgi:hypothetical protein
MICPPCRQDRHGDCAEMIRQESEGLTATELAGSAWCDCQHEPRQASPAGIRIVTDERKPAGAALLVSPASIWRPAG